MRPGVDPVTNAITMTAPSRACPGRIQAIVAKMTAAVATATRTW